MHSVHAFPRSVRMSPPSCLMIMMIQHRKEMPILYCHCLGVVDGLIYISVLLPNFVLICTSQFWEKLRCDLPEVHCFQVAGMPACHEMQPVASKHDFSEYCKSENTNKATYLSLDRLCHFVLEYFVLSYGFSRISRDIIVLVWLFQ